MKVIEDHQCRLLRSDSSNEVAKAIEQVAPRLRRWQIKRWRKLRDDVPEFGDQPRQFRPLVSQCAQTVQFRRALDKVLQDFHERQIGDSFVVLGAMPDQQRHSLRVSNDRNLIGESRLADARFAGNQEHAPAPSGRIVESAEQRSQLALTSDYDAQRPSSKLFRAICLRSANLCDESIAPGRDRKHESRRLRIIAQGPPELSYRRVDAGLAIDKDALAPDALQNFFARNELS